MSGESDLIKLYSGQILALAADIPLTERLTAPHASVKRRAPLCGSTVTVDIRMDAGKISAFGQDVKACALGQAAASVVAANIIGRSTDEIERARNELSAMLRTGGPAPSPPFDALKVLLPARDYKNRHDSIMLALEATLEALAEARKSACA